MASGDEQLILVKSNVNDIAAIVLKIDYTSLTWKVHLSSKFILHPRKYRNHVHRTTAKAKAYPMHYYRSRVSFIRTPGGITLADMSNQGIWYSDG